MLRLILILIALGAVILGFDWLIDQPGRITIELPGFVMEPTLAQVAIFLVLLAILSIIVWTICRVIINGPAALNMFLNNRREKHGLEALRAGLVAIGSGDTRLADTMAKRAHNLLGPQPLTQLIYAQTALARQDFHEAIASFETMRAGNETKIIGLNGLFEIAVTQGDLKAAYALAEEAFEAADNLKWAGFASMEGRAAAGEWELALEALEALKKHHHVTKDEEINLKSTILTAQAAVLEVEEPTKALKVAEAAHKLNPGLTNAAVIAGRIASANNEVSKATKILERAWKKSPHPDIAEIYAHARAGDTAIDRMQRVKNLIKKRSSHSEAPIALARSAIECGEFEEARAALGMIQDQDITKRICALHAQLEDADGNNTGKVREWLARAIKAPVDPIWIADGITSQEWLPQSSITGKIGVFEWKIPPQSESDGLTLSADKVNSLFETLPILDDNLAQENLLEDNEANVIDLDDTENVIEIIQPINEDKAAS